MTESSRLTAPIRLVQTLIAAWCVFVPPHTLVRAIGAILVVGVIEILSRIALSDHPRWVKLVRLFAFLIGLRALTNLGKPLFPDSAFVFFGALLHGPTAAVLAVAVGLFMLIYAWEAWNRRKRAVPMSIAYAAFVALNIPLFAVFNAIPGEPKYWVGGAAFAVIGIGVTAGMAYLLHAHRDELA